MKKMTPIIALGAICLIGLNAHGETKEANLHVNNGSSSTEFLLNKVQSITFDGTTMNVNVKDGSTEQFDITALDNLTFDFTLQSGVDKISTDSINGVSLSLVNGILTASTGEDSPMKVDVYSLNGVRVKSVYGMATVTLDLNDLQKGMYVIKANGTTSSYIR